ncbi:MAG TPA: hypothetical protein VF188_14635 [Longimicrobiales bacterium]
MRTSAFGAMASAVLVLIAGACQDLDVVNLNNPDRERALAEPGDVEALIGSTWVGWWNRMVNASSLYLVMPTVADEGTATYANAASLELSSEPRPPFNNNPTSEAHGLSRNAWESFNEILSNANEGLFAIENGLVLETQDPGGDELSDNTERGRAFAMFARGLALGYLALFFDQAYITQPETDYEDLPPMSPYMEVRDSAVAAMESAIAVMEANAFTLPYTWLYVDGVTNEDLARIAHSFIARFLVYTARSPAQREGVDWNEVLRHIQAGITEDFAPVQDGDALYGYLWYYGTNNGSFSQHADYKLIGPADVSGNYQAWLGKDLRDRQPFLITTPDRRITGVDENGAPDPTADGKYFEYREDIPFTESRGIYHFSHYQWNRALSDWHPTEPWYSGPAHIMTVDEMNLLAAEAYYRLGMLQKAADLINLTRVGNGELPPVTTDGVPEAPDCVPRPQTDPAGSCGSLLDALHYERMIELAYMDGARTWMDRRGFGSLPEGTFLQLPVPGRELISLGYELYTFGGVGGTCAAGNATTCE